MFESAFSVIGSAASGSAIKIAAGLFQNWFDSAAEKRQAEHEREMARYDINIRDYEVRTANPYTNHTRRRLAYGVCFTLCAIAAYCTLFPDIVFFATPISPSEPQSYSILFGLFEWSGRTPSVEAVVITSGEMAYKFVHAAIMYLGFYFTPIGKK